MNIELIEPDAEVAALTIPERATLALGSDKARTHLAELAKKSVAILEIKNPAGRAECHSAVMALVNARTTIQKTGKAARDDATKFSKAVIAAENELIEITAAEEARLFALRDAWDAQVAIEKAAREQAERELAAAIQARIDALGLDVTLVQASSFDLAKAAAQLTQVEISLEVFGSRAGEAMQLRNTTLTQIEGLHTAAVAREALQAQLAEQQRELDEQRAALAAEQAAADARRRAEEAKLAAERAEFEAQQAAERERVEAIARAELEAERAAAAARQKVLDDEAAAERQVLAERAAAERQRLADEAAAAQKLIADAAEARRRQEVEAAEAAREAERQAAIERNAAADAAFLKDQKVRNAACDMLSTLAMVLECIRTGAIVAPDAVAEVIEHVIENATGEPA